MKFRIYTIILTGILGFTQVCYGHSEHSETSIEEVKKETRDLIQTIGSYSADKKDEAVKTAKDGLKELDKDIDALESKIDENWNQMSASARKEARARLKTLRKQRIKVAEWYGSMKASSADAWGHIKKGFSDAYEKLARDWEKSEEEFLSNE